MNARKPERKFVWTVVPNGTGRAVEEGTDALRWLGGRLLFERWLQALRSGAAGSEVRSA